MSDITLSRGVRSNLLALQNTAEMLASTQEKLATGRKVNSALDNPTNFFTASSLNSRAGDLNRLLDSVGNGVQTLRAADQGIKSLTKLVESAQATARQALQASAGTLSFQLTGILGKALAADTAATGTGSVAFATADAAASKQGNALVSQDGKATTIGTGKSFTGSTSLSTLTDIADGESFKIKIGADELTVNFSSSAAADLDGSDNAVTLKIAAGQSTIDDLKTAINSKFSSLASVSGGNIKLEVQNTTDDLNITDASNGVLKALGLASTDVAATLSVEAANTDFAALISSNATLKVKVGTGAEQTITFGNDDSANQVSNLAELKTRLDALTGVDASVASNKLTIQNADTADKSSTIQLTGSAAGVLTAIGFTADSGSTTVSTISPTNLLSQDTDLAGQSFTVKVGNNSRTITFGSGTGQVATKAQLEAQLDGVQGLSAEWDVDNKLKITASTVGDDISLSGDALGDLGLSDVYRTANTDVGTALAGQSLTFQVGSGAVQTIGFGTGTGQVSSRAQLKTALQGLSGITANIDSSNRVTVTSLDRNQTLKIGGSQSALDAVGLTGGNYTPGSGSVTAESSTRASLMNDFNNLLTQIDTVAKDASFNGVNLLDGDDLTVIFNEDGTSKLSISGVTFDSRGLGITKATNNAFQFDGEINAVMGNLDKAINTLRTQASRFGSNLSVVETRQDFTKGLINVLRTGADNLTLADQNEEAANLLSLQTRQQLASTSLSLANQADQGVLRLF